MYDQQTIMEDEHRFTVYKHTNKINGKIYIGITGVGVYNRWGKNGVNYLKDKCRFSHAIRKYGWDNFTHEILFENLTREDACQKEIQLIKEWNLQDPNIGYNINSGGDLNNYHVKHSQETKDKISKANSNIIIGKYDCYGKLIETYCNLKEVANFLGMHNTTLPIHLKNNPHKELKGFYWKICCKDLNLPLQLNLDDFEGEDWIVSFNLLGDQMSIYKSIAEASKDIGVFDTSLGTHIYKHSSKLFKGLFWIKFCKCLRKDIPKHLEQLPSNILYKYDSNFQFVDVYESFKDAERKNNFTISSLSSYINFNPKSLYKNYYWVLSDRLWSPQEVQEYFYIEPVPPKIAIYSTDNILIGEYSTYYKAEKELKLPIGCIRQHLNLKSNAKSAPYRGYYIFKKLN